ncbi:hypothetical protein BDV09DRAFT_109181 [Aspergillus tetrazonus]
MLAQGFVRSGMLGFLAGLRAGCGRRLCYDRVFLLTSYEGATRCLRYVLFTDSLGCYFAGLSMQLSETFVIRWLFEKESEVRQYERLIVTNMYIEDNVQFRQSARSNAVNEARN